MPWVCGIYDNRPDVCKRYPQANSYQPDSCGYFFAGDGKRQGRCEEDCDSSCCRLPRQGGEPGGAALPAEAGGLPCKYLDYSEEEITFAPPKTEEAEGDIREAPVKAEE